MRPGPALRSAVRWTHDPWADECLPDWAPDDFEWTIPPESYTSRAMRLMTEWRGSQRAIPRAHRRVTHAIRHRLEVG